MKIKHSPKLSYRPFRGLRGKIKKARALKRRAKRLALGYAPEYA